MATFNCERTIISALSSLASQSCYDFELVVVDGGSTDNTLKLINGFFDEFNLFDVSIVSEPDFGIYDALNKGFRRARGEVISILHSDDVYSSDAIEIIYSEFYHTGLLVGFFPVSVVRDLEGDYFTNPILYAVPENIPRALRFGHMPPHPGMVLRKEIFDLIGFYSTDYVISSDFEFILRFVCGGYRFYVSKSCFYAFTLGGVSTRGLYSYIVISYELHSVFRHYRLRFAWFRSFFRFVFKFFSGNFRGRFGLNG